MEFYQLEHFVAVVEEHSFTRAAERVFRTQGAVSVAIRKLEEELGVPLMLRDTMFHARLSGLSQEVTLTTVVDGQPVDLRRGSLLWTHFGVSGPVVMDASRFWTLAREQGAQADVYANLLPDWTADAVRDWFRTEAASTPRRSLAKTLALLVPERLAEAVCAALCAEPGRATAQVPRADAMLAYVAVTRARQVLDPEGLAWVEGWL